MAPHESELPEFFVLPPLPPAIDVWFALAADRADGTEVIFDGAILDDLGVVDAASAKLALIGYRWTFEDGRWVDQAASGEWNEHWIVLDSINADPLIADLSAPGVPVFEAPHGEGTWNPRTVADSIAAFVDALEVNDDVPGPPPWDDESDAEWSVWAVDLGREPLRTLVALSGWPLFDRFDRSELLQLRAALPAQIAHGLTEAGAASCVEYGEGFGARFEARTYARARTVAPPVEADLVFADEPDEYTEPAPSDELIASVEAEIGFRLPDALIALARRRNGGRLVRNAHPMSEPTGWADDHIAVTGLYAIGRTSRYALAGELGATFMREEWGYPEWGIGIADTPTAGHEQIMLDYRESGPQGEPRVVYVDQERDYLVTEVAPDVATFLGGLVDSDIFDDSHPEAERAADLARVASGSLSPIIVRALSASPDLPFGEAAIRTLGRRLVARHGFFTVRGDDDSRMLLDTLFLLHSRVASAAGLDELLDPTGDSAYDRPSLPLMIFFSLADDPFGFRTGGYAPGFVEDWWNARVAADILEHDSDRWRLTPGAVDELVDALRNVAETEIEAEPDR